MSLDINILVRWILAIAILLALMVFFPAIADGANKFYDKINFWSHDKDEQAKASDHFDAFNKALREDRIKDGFLTVDEVNSVIGGLTYVQKLDWTGGELHLLKSNIGSKNIYFLYFPATHSMTVFTGPTPDKDDQIVYSYNELVNQQPFQTLNGALRLKVRSWWVFNSLHSLSPLTGPDHDKYKLPSELRKKVEQVVP